MRERRREREKGRSEKGVRERREERESGEDRRERDGGFAVL